MAPLAAYKDYRESGISWLERIPSHWRVTKFKRYCDIQLGKMLQPQPSAPTDIQVPYLRAMHVQWEKVDTSELPEMWASQREVKKFGVKSGDLLVCEGGEVGRTAILNGIYGDCIIQNALHRIRGNENTFAPYINYLMRHIADAKWFDILCNKATIAHLTGEKLGELCLPLPSSEEQQAIARFLDFKTAQIDTLIAKQKTLLDKLAEKRTALISHAVTKGLDPKAPMKNSGVTWLGQIPAHWTALPLRRLIQTVKTGTTPAGVNEFHFSDSGVSWFRPGDFSDQIFIESAEKRLSDEGVAEVRVFPAFTVMHVGIGATIGKVGVTTELSSCNQQINAIVCNERLHHLFAAYFLQAIKEYIVKCGKYTTLPIINQDETKALCFTVPPVDEQVEISEYLLRKEQLLEQQAKKISQVIAKLQEYRSALITNAVTGKVDVRDVPIGQPPEA